MNPIYENYAYRGRTFRQKVIKICQGLVFYVILPLLILNSGYIKYICAKSDYIRVPAVILEKRHSGNGGNRLSSISQSVIVEYQDENGNVKSEMVRTCVGDVVGGKTFVAINKETGEVVRTRPTVNTLQVIGFCAYIYIIFCMQFQKWKGNPNSICATVIEKKKTLCDGQWREYVVCNYIDESGKEFLFESEKLPNQIMLSKGEMVQVMVDPKDYSSYFVQLETSAISWRKVKGDS